MGWAIDGPVATHVADGRRMLYTATSGAEGIGGPQDLLVRPLTNPGQGIRVMTGTGLIRSRYVSANNESYQGSVDTQQVVATSPTLASKRSDLVVMRVEDPWADNSPWPEPSTGDLPTYDAFPIRIIEGVSATTTRLQDVPGYQNQTAITLARIDFPASTTTVSQGMITDLRELAQPRRSEVVFARPRVAEDDGSQAYLSGTTAGGGEFFPGGGGFSNQFTAYIPEWANRMVIDASWMAIFYAASRDPRGSYWIEFGDEYRPHTWPSSRQYEFATQWFNFNSPMGSDARSTNWLLMDNRAIPKKLRGKTVTFVFKAGLSNSPGSNSVFMNATGGLGCRLTFVETALGWEDAI